MRKLLLVVSLHIIAFPVCAQRYVTTDGQTPRKMSISAMRAAVNSRYTTQDPVSRKTLSGARWYSYVEAMDTATLFDSITGGLTGVALWTPVMWNDTNGLLVTTSGVVHNTLTCEASILDPKAKLFNSDKSMAYKGLIEVGPADGYQCDSVDIFGVYKFNETKTTVVDTLRLLFTTGNGGPPKATNLFGSTLPAGGVYGAAIFMGMAHDSLNNKGTGSQPAALYYQDIILDNSSPTSPAWGDTLANGVWVKRICVAPPPPYSTGTGRINCSAGENLGCSITFISGDPETKGGGKLASPSPGDTLITGVGSGKNTYNIWQPLVGYYTTRLSGVPVTSRPPYLLFEAPYGDINSGHWKDPTIFSGGWKDMFVPVWEWNNWAAPSELQFPYISWHISCSYCGPHPPGSYNTPVVNRLAATIIPNPAIDRITINYSFPETENVEVSLISISGEVVAMQHANSTGSGQVVFDVSGIAAGTYMYSITTASNTARGVAVILH